MIDQRRPLRIAFLGTRGIPASYSGFETCVEELGARLAARGHRVTAYCRSHHIKWPQRRYRGVRLVKLRSVATKHLDTISHTALSALHLLARPSYRPDLVYLCGVGNAPVAVLLRRLGVPVVFNVDGSDWQREKWGRLASAYLRLSEQLAVAGADCLVADSRAVQQHYLKDLGVHAPFLPYGATRIQRPPGPTLARFGLAPRHYLLFVGRLVPENTPHELIEAFAALPDRAGQRLVIVGDAPYSGDYIAGLKATAERLAPGEVVFTGYVFGEGYRELLSNCTAFVLSHGVGGTHPVLIEAMASRACVIVRDAPPNVEVIGETGLTYRRDDAVPSLTATLARVLAMPEAERDAYRQAALDRVTRLYDWDRVTDAYERLFYDLLAGHSPGAHRHESAPTWDAP